MRLLVIVLRFILEASIPDKIGVIRYTTIVKVLIAFFLCFMTTLSLGVQYNAYTPFMKDKFTTDSSLDKFAPSYFQLRKNNSFLTSMGQKPLFSPKFRVEMLGGKEMKMSKSLVDNIFCFTPRSFLTLISNSLLFKF